jgi:hypothetical protein
MTGDNKEEVLSLLNKHKELGLSEQIDYAKSYLYSIIANSTALEGSTLTEEEVQRLFDEDAASPKRAVMEQKMNPDLKMVDKTDIAKKMVDKWSIKPSLAGKLADILLFMADKREVKTEDIVSHFGFTATTAKRYLRHLTEFGYLEARGGNRNRTYVPREW